MTLEQRLHDGLTQEAERVNPDVPAALFTAQWNQRPPHRSRARVIAIAVTAAVLAVVPLMIFLTRTGNGGTPASPPATSLVGMFATHVAYQSGVVAQDELTGTWVMNISVDGTVDLSPPHNAVDVRIAPVHFTSTGSTTVTNLFAEDLCQAQPSANYRWEITGGHLRFASIDDRCSARIAVLTTEPWHPGGA